MKVLSFQLIYRMSRVIAHFWLFWERNYAFMLFLGFDQYNAKYSPPWDQIPQFWDNNTSKYWYYAYNFPI
jgi:hypothetical protein